MKKMMMTLAAVLCCAMTTTVFTACGSDDDNTTKPDANKAVAAAMDYSLTTSDEMLAIFDLTIEYYDANSNVQTEQMTGKTWAKKVTAKLPATLGLRLKAQLKAGVDVSTKEKVTVSYGYNYMGYAINAKGEVVGDVVSKEINTHSDMKGEKVAEWLTMKTDGLVKYLFDFDANGKVSTSSWR